MRKPARAFLIGIAWCWTAAFAEAQVPQPARFPANWELDFAFHDPQALVITLPGDDRPSVFWYVLYRAENNTGRDIQYFPTAELVTESLEVVRGGENISPTVYDAIVERHRRTDPFLIVPGKTLGTFLQGEDNAKSSMMVFKDFNQNDNEFTIYFGGLSGEIQRVPNPRYRRSEVATAEQPRYFTLRKTLAVKYRVPGDSQTRRQAGAQRLSQEWIMR